MFKTSLSIAPHTIFTVQSLETDQPREGHHGSVAVSASFDDAETYKVAILTRAQAKTLGSMLLGAAAEVS